MNLTKYQPNDNRAGGETSLYPIPSIRESIPRNGAIAQERKIEDFPLAFCTECVEGSGIARSLYDAAVAIIQDNGMWEPNRALNQKVSTQYQTRRPHSYGAIAMFKNEDGTYWQAKALSPRVFDGKENKYETLTDNGARAFLPAITQETWRKIALKNNLPIEGPWLNSCENLNESDLPLESEPEEALSENGAKPSEALVVKEASTLKLQAQESPIFWGFAKNSKTSIRHTALRQSHTLSQLGLKELQSALASAPGNLRVPNFWVFVQAHPEINLVITEGAKKSLSLLSQGDVAIALYGCWAGLLKHDKIEGEKIRRVKPELIPDLDCFAQPDRHWSIAFDQDTKPETYCNVQKATGELAFYLEQSGGKVSIVQWDGQNGRCKGVDDLIVNAGVEAWEKALQEATPAPEWRISRRLANAVKRKPDMHIGDREFKEVAAELPNSGLVALYGGKGTGKSEAIAAMLHGRTWISVTALRSVAREQAAGFGGVFVNDGDRFGDRLLDESGHPVKGGSVCIPSLLKVQRVEAEVLVLDETTAIAEFLLISKLANKDGLRPLLLAEFIRRVRDAQQVILGDADLTQEGIDWIEGIRGDRCYLVRSKRHALTYEATMIDSQNEAIGKLQERADSLADGKIIYINCDSKPMAEELAETLGSQQSLLIHRDTSSQTTQSSFMASRGEDIPELILMGIKYIISSPSVVQGFSIKHHTELIDSVWGIYLGCSITAHNMAQALDRVRSTEVPRFVWVARKGRAYSKLSRAQSSRAFLKEFKQLNSASARLVIHSLTPDTIAAVDSIDWLGQNIEMVASLEVRRNQGMMELRHTLIALLKHEGKTVVVDQPIYSKQQLKAVGQHIREIGQRLKAAHYTDVANAEELNSEQATALSEKSEALTPEQALSLEKFYLGEFYKLDKVTLEDVSFDKGSRIRHRIQNFEVILNQELADSRTAVSINQSPQCPQDWKAASVQWKLLELSGAGKFIEDIYAGKIESYTSADVQPMSEFFVAHAREFRIAFNCSNIGNVSPIQAIGVILDWCGIKRTRKQTTRGGERKDFYEIDKQHLAKVSAIMARRGKVNTPPLDERVIEGGVLTANPGNTAHNVVPIAPDIGQIRGLADTEDRDFRYG